MLFGSAYSLTHQPWLLNTSFETNLWYTPVKEIPQLVLVKSQLRSEFQQNIYDLHCDKNSKFWFWGSMLNDKEQIMLQIKNISMLYLDTRVLVNFMWWYLCYSIFSQMVRRIHIMKWHCQKLRILRKIPLSSFNYYKRMT